jgi:hypothetical protein
MFIGHRKRFVEEEFYNCELRYIFAYAERISKNIRK